MKKIKFKEIKSKYIIVMFLILISTLLLLTQGILNGWMKQNQDDMMEDTLKLAKVYSMNMGKSMKAKDSLFQLIDERLLTAGTTLKNKDIVLDNDYITGLAKELNVDIIYLYNKDGVIEFDNTQKYIGWRAALGHPVRNFIESQALIHLDEIRKDSESDLYYKYLYIRLSDGRFFQIGILESKIDGFLSGFKMSELINEIGEDSSLSFVHFIDENDKIVESNNPSEIGKSISDGAVVKGIAANQEYQRLIVDDKIKTIEVYVPVYVDFHKTGTLAIGKNAGDLLDNTQKVIRNAMWILGCLLFLLMVFSLFIVKKNKRNNSIPFDELTGLPNESYMKEFLHKMVNDKRKRNKAVFLINIPYFRTVNMTLGFETGDRIIKEVAKRLDKLLKSSGMLFRLKEDQFVFCIDEYESSDQLLSLSNQMVKTFEKSFRYFHKSKQIQPEIGIVEVDDKYDNVDDLMKDASIAVTNLSNVVGNSLIFCKEMRKRVDRDEIIEMELIKSLNQTNQETIYLEYQPKINLINDEIVGFEALCRMDSKVLGRVPPSEFILIAEEKQLIVPLGALILEKACLFTNKIVTQDNISIRMAVNISGMQLIEENFITIVKNIVKRTGIKYKNLELEITETVLLENYTLINHKLEELRTLGVKIAMDDFGTGFSSLACIEGLNIDTVKIDQHFISKIIKGDEEDSITADIISMSHKLGLFVIAEGVETEIQKDYLIKNGCDNMQGFYFSKPISEKAVQEILIK